MVFHLHVFKMAFRWDQVFCKIPASKAFLHPWYSSVLVFIVAVVNLLCSVICDGEGSVAPDCS